MKKSLLKILCVICAAVCVFAFAACGDSSSSLPAASETFTGAVSEQSYESQDSAAQAFVSAEINGESTSATFVSYSKTADLTADEISALNVSETVTSGEQGYVSYSTSTASTAAAGLTSGSSSENTQKLYILKVDNEYKYYTPALSSGENLTKSYLESVLDADNYRNYTLKNKIDYSLSYSGSTNQNVKASGTMTLKITENGAIGSFPFKMTIEGMTVSATGNYYYVKVNGGYYIYATATFMGITETALDFFATDEEYEYLTNIGANTSGYGVDMTDTDHTYFVKTDTGFSVREDKMTALLNALFSDMMSGSGVNVNINKFALDFYVSSGLIYQIKQNFAFNMTSYGETATLSMNNTMTLTNIGTTDMGTIPQDVIDYITSKDYTVASVS